MLSVHVGYLEDSIWNTSNYFDAWFDRDNLLKPFAKKVIKEIDKSEVLSKYNILSPVFGSMPTQMLSGGTKTLLLIKYNNAVVNLEHLGENCYQFLVDISREQDVLICVEGVNDLFNDTDVTEIKVENTGEVITNKLDYIQAMMDLEG
jgi:hypothetical protein